MNSKAHLFLLSVIMLFFGCSYHHNGILTGNAAITNKDFKFLGTVSEQTEATYIVGFGGLNKDALIMQAKNNLYKKYKLKEGIALANVSVDYKTTFWLSFFYFKTTITVSVDIINFDLSKPLTLDSLFDKTATIYKTTPATEVIYRYEIDKKDTLLTMGSWVIYETESKALVGQVVDAPTYGKVKIAFLMTDGNWKYQNIHRKKLKRVIKK